MQLEESVMAIAAQALIPVSLHRDYSRTAAQRQPIETSFSRSSKSPRASGSNKIGVIRILFKVKNWIFDPYRPERHYMRGPGPKWHAKHTAQSFDLGMENRI